MGKRSIGFEWNQYSPEGIIDLDRHRHIALSPNTSAAILAEAANADTLAGTYSIDGAMDGTIVESITDTMTGSYTNTSKTYFGSLTESIPADTMAATYTSGSTGLPEWVFGGTTDLLGYDLSSSVATPTQFATATAGEFDYTSGQEANYQFDHVSYADFHAASNIYYSIVVDGQDSGVGGFISHKRIAKWDVSDPVGNWSLVNYARCVEPKFLQAYDANRVFAWTKEESTSNQYGVCLIDLTGVTPVDVSNASDMIIRADIDTLIEYPKFMLYEATTNTLFLAGNDSNSLGTIEAWDVTIPASPTLRHRKSMGGYPSTGVLLPNAGGVAFAWLGHPTYNFGYFQGVVDNHLIAYTLDAGEASTTNAIYQLAYANGYILGFKSNGGSGRERIYVIDESTRAVAAAHPLPSNTDAFDDWSVIGNTMFEARRAITSETFARLYNVSNPVAGINLVTDSYRYRPVSDNFTLPVTHFYGKQTR